jgi:hypothetical protein
VNPLQDSLMQCALASMCHRVLPFVTAEWAKLAPEVLGSLTSAVQELPCGLSIEECYGVWDWKRAGVAIPPLPSLLKEILELRAEIYRGLPLEVIDSAQDAIGEYLEAESWVEVLSRGFRGAHSPSEAVEMACLGRLDEASATMKRALREVREAFRRRERALDRFVLLSRGGLWVGMVRVLSYEEVEERTSIEDMHRSICGC